ncbi:MAG: pilus assembly protein PilM [Candidatus Saccharimonas sp.]
MSKLFYHTKPLIGLDISQTGIKVMSIDPKHWLVRGYGSLDLDPKKVQESLEDPENLYLTEKIGSLMNDHLIGDLNSDQVVIGVPTSRTYSRTFTIPTKEISHLASAVEVEVDQYIPIPMSALYIDYEIIEQTKEQSTVIMSAVPRQLIDSCMKAVEGVNLTPVIIEPNINAIARVLEATEEGHLLTMIVDIGPASTDIAILDKGVVRLTGSIAIGGNTFTLALAKYLGTTLENAHQLKVLNGLSAGPRQAKISAALKPSLSRISSEIRKVIRYYHERLGDNSKIEQLLIVGGGSNVPGIGDFFTNDLVMPARVASPWQKLDFGKLQQPHKQFRPRYITVAGLASLNSEDIWK